jgi:dipeptidyl aminopeptidase/acylaminoacyl peptidase
MKPILLCALMLTTAALAVQDVIDPDLAAYGEGIAALCAEKGLTGRVAWVSDRDGDPEIYVMDLDEGYPYRLTAFEGEDRHPALSPDGEKLAWVSEMDGRADVYLMDLGGSGRDRVWERLTDTPDYERDLSWSADGERLYFSAYEAIDYGTVGLFAGSTEELAHLAGRRNGFAAYYYDLSYGAVERQSIFPGDFRSPVHVAGLGVVCRYEPWSAEVSPLPAGLVLIHDALACDPLGYCEGWEFAGPLRRYPDGDLLVPYSEGDRSCYARLSPHTGEEVYGWCYPGLDRLNGLPDPAGGDWFVCQTAPDGDPEAEMVLVGEATSAEVSGEIYLTQNDSYDGEPTWAVVEGE